MPVLSTTGAQRPHNKVLKQVFYPHCTGEETEAQRGSVSSQSHVADKRQTLLWLQAFALTIQPPTLKCLVALEKGQRSLPASDSRPSGAEERSQGDSPGAHLAPL